MQKCAEKFGLESLTLWPLIFVGYVDGNGWVSRLATVIMRKRTRRYTPINIRFCQSNLRKKKHREQLQHNIRSERTAFAYAWIQKFSHRRRRAIEEERGKERGGTGKIDNARELKRHKRTNIKTVHLSVWVAESIQSYGCWWWATMWQR